MQNMTIVDMVGRTMISVTPAEQGSEEISFVSSDGLRFLFYHSQDCCEGVAVEDVCGDLCDLIGSPITLAEEATSEDGKTIDPFTGAVCAVDYEDSQTWTFYKFSTIKGSVTVRWLGQSNGYYSERVDLAVTKIPAP